MKRVLTIGAIALAAVLMLGAAALAGSLGKQVAHDQSRSWKHPAVHAEAFVHRPHAMAVKLRAHLSRPLDGGWQLTCYRHGGRSSRSKARKFEHKDPPVIVRLQPTMRNPRGCDLTADGYYSTREHGRLVLNLYAKK